METETSTKTGTATDANTVLAAGAYRAGKPRFSTFHGYEVCDIYKREKLFGLIPYWRHSDTIKNAGQVDEVVMLLNNPNELKKRLIAGISTCR